MTTTTIRVKHQFRPACLFGKPQSNGYRPVFRDGQQIGSVRVMMDETDHVCWIVNRKRYATWKEAKRALEAK